MAAITDTPDYEIRMDGGQLHTGRTTSTLYYWADPDTDAALAHTTVNDEQVIPFFDSVGAAERYLDQRASTGVEEDYAGLSLYRAKVKKTGDAVDVLMEQSGLDNFAPDGGTLQELDESTGDLDYSWFE